MTVSEIKDLTKYLSQEDVEKIKQEIKNKEALLKSENLDEEELGMTFNTLFAILVIEKTLESEIEEIEDIRAELEEELMESYKTYDSFMVKFKKEDKKKKKNWLLKLLFLSDRIHTQKDGIKASKKAVAELQKDLATVKEQKNDRNLKAAIADKKGPKFEKFCNCPKDIKNPLSRPASTKKHEKKRMEKRNQNRAVKKANSNSNKGTESSMGVNLSKDATSGLKNLYNTR